MLKKLAMGAALATLLAAPALAQSINPGWGTGNTLPTYYDGQGHLHAGYPAARNPMRARERASQAYAYVPARAAVNADSPALTGGGSVGYNEGLQITY